MTELALDLSVASDVSVVKTLRPQELCKAVLDYLNPHSRISYFADSGRALPRAAHETPRA